MTIMMGPKKEEGGNERVLAVQRTGRERKAAMRKQQDHRVKFLIPRERRAKEGFSPRKRSIGSENWKVGCCYEKCFKP